MTGRLSLSASERERRAEAIAEHRRKVNVRNRPLAVKLEHFSALVLEGVKPSEALRQAGLHD